MKLELFEADNLVKAFKTKETIDELFNTIGGDLFIDVCKAAVSIRENDCDGPVNPFVWVNDKYILEFGMESLSPLLTTLQVLCIKIPD